MKHQEKSNYVRNAARAKRILSARAVSVEVGRQAEEEVVREVLGPDALSSTTAQFGLSEFEATEFVGSAVRDSFLGFAISCGVKAAKPGMHDLLYATDRIFGALWRLRKLIDELGVPYDFYVPRAVEYWDSKSSRAPRLTQLMHPDIITRVLQEWSAREVERQSELAVCE